MLADLFTAALPSELRAKFSALPELEQSLSKLLDKARGAKASIHLSDQQFLSFVAERIPLEADPQTIFQKLNLADLYLACGCSVKNTDAAYEFTSRYFPLIERAARSLTTQPVAIQDLQQMVYQKLFVGSAEEKPKISHYKGEGELIAWVRVVATRMLIDEQRKQVKEAPLDDVVLATRAAAGDDPETRLLRQRFQHDFKQAFAQAIDQLTVEERNLLRFHYLDQLNLDQLGVICQIHRATAARQLIKIRQKLLAQTRQILFDRLKLEGEAFESIVGLLDSQFNLSISRILKYKD